MLKTMILVALGLTAVLLAGASQADEPDRPQPPPPRVQYFDSDPAACKPENISASFHAHLLPWADQGPEVMARLRQVQSEMTLASLRRCVLKGLLTRDQALALVKDLGLTLPAAQAGGAQTGTPP
jgi:hypothetical protein